MAETTKKEYSAEEMEEARRKIALMLTLADGTKGTPEGDNARAHAIRTMAKFRIVEAEIDFGNKNNSAIYEDEVDGLNDPGGHRQWVVDLARALANTFDCRYYMNTWKGTITFLGSEKDLITVTFFFENVLNHVNKGARKDWPADRNWRKRNIFGTAAGVVIGDRLFAIKKAMDASIQKNYSGGSELMIIKMDLVNEEYGKIKFGDPLKRKDVNIDDRKTWMAGRINGQTAALNLGIDSTEEEETEEEETEELENA